MTVYACIKGKHVLGVQTRLFLSNRSLGNAVFNTHFLSVILMEASISGKSASSWRSLSGGCNHKREEMDALE